MDYENIIQKKLIKRNKMILQRVLFPSENRPKELYMRDKGEWVSFDTFFNSFSI